MTISTEVRRAGPFAGDGEKTSIPFGFKVFSAGDVEVTESVTETGVETVLTLDTDYVVALNEDQDVSPGGVVALNTAPAVGRSITLTSRVPAVQPVELANQSGFYPTVINDALDRLTILVQQVDEKVRRAIKIPVSVATGQDYEVTVTTPDLAAAAATSATAAAASAAQAQAAVAGALNISSAGASKFPRSNDGGTAWEYLTAEQTLAALNVVTTVATQSEMETGTSSSVRLMTPQRIAQAIATLAPQPTSGGSGGSSSSVLTGTILPFAGASGTAPSGYLFCQGANVSRTTYAELFAVVGTTWGAGDGSTTFTLPDLRRRTLVGSGGDGTATLGNAIGNVGGAETHTLTTAQMPAHSHVINSYLALMGGSQYGLQLSANGNTSTDKSTSSTGTGNAHNNMQPSAVVRYIIKT